MSTIKQTAEGANFTAINFGKLSEVLEKAKGKIFLKEATKSTGTEISISVLPPKGEFPFFHAHKQNEETYIFISGKGKFQVDDVSFDISEGSVVRVATAGSRNLINTSDEEMVYIVVQSKENSLQQYTMDDGALVETVSLLK